MNQVFEKSFGILVMMPLARPGNSSAATTQSTGREASAPLRKPRYNISESERRYAVMHGNIRLRVAIWAMVACLFALAQAAPVYAQQHKSKIPVIGKMTARSNRQAYSGTIQSLDLKQKVLSVKSRQGRDTEIFPLRKDIHVEGINGEKMKLKALTPGTSILIYYEEKGGERLVKNIIVLESGKSESEHAPTS